MKETEWRACTICGAQFPVTHGAQKNCEMCRRDKWRSGNAPTVRGRRARLKGNQRAIERKALEAQAHGASYGKWEGKEYARTHVRVVIPQIDEETSENDGSGEPALKAATEEGEKGE